MPAIRGRQPRIPFLWPLTQDVLQPALAEARSLVFDPRVLSNRSSPADLGIDSLTGLGEGDRAMDVDLVCSATIQPDPVSSLEPRSLDAVGDRLRAQPVSAGLLTIAEAARVVPVKARAACDDSGGLCATPLVAQSLSSTEGGDVILGTAMIPLDQTFCLQSNPGASKTIYLDFNGHTTTGTGWNNATMGTSFYSPAWDLDGNPASFNDSELATIQAVWQQVSQRFSCFDANVTTMAPPPDWLVNSGGTDANYGVRAVLTSYGPSSGSCSGIAHVSSFSFGVDDPVFIYTRGVGAAKTVSHEVGHSLGLQHDGVLGFEYYAGHGQDVSSWAPVMGSSSNTTHVVQWDDGTYYNSTNTGTTANYNHGAGDLEVITGSNGFGFMSDLVGDSAATAAQLGISSGTIAQFGAIETRFDSDWFSFQLATTGDLDLTFDPYWYRAYVDDDGIWGGSLTSSVGRVRDSFTSTGFVENGAALDLAVDLFDASGTRLASVNDVGLDARLFLQGLSAGTYYLRLDGVGFGDPTSSTPTGYTDYGSIGNYWISGTITGSVDPVPMPVISLSLASSSVLEDGSSNLLYTFTRSLVTADPLTVNFTVGGTATNGVDYSGLLAGSNQSVTFAANAASVSVLLDPTADATLEADETVSMQLAGGVGYTVGTVDAVTGTISNDDVTAPAALLAFSTSADSLTGTSAADSFLMNRLSDSLWSATPDRIIALEAGVDSIDSPFSRTRAIYARQMGAVKTLDAAGIGTLLTSKNFVKNGACTFTYGSGSSLRTFLAINDGVGGFSASSDSVIEITGYSGNLSSLAIF